MRKVFCLILVLLFTQHKAQDKFFTKLGGNGDDIGYNAKPTTDNNFIIVGSSTSNGTHGFSDIYLSKVNMQGQQLWEKFIGGSSNDVGKSIIELPDKGFLVVGYTSSFGAGGYDAFILRVDMNGEVIWQKTFGGSDWDFANDVVLASDNNLVVVGITSSFGYGNRDGFALKFDLNGNLLWQKFYGSQENDELRAVINTNDNLIAATGYTEGKDIDGDGYFVKMDLNGDTIFTRSWGGPYKDFANDLVQKANNDYLMAGAKTYTLNGKTHSYFYTITAIGNYAVDSSRYHSTDNEQYISCANSALTASLTALLRTVPVPAQNIDGNVIVAYQNGFEHIVNSFGGSEDENFYSVEPTVDGGFVMVGSTLSYGSEGWDVYLIKVDTAIILTYTNMVRVLERAAPTSTKVSYFGDHQYEISVGESKLITSVDLFDLYGRKLSTSQSKANFEKIDLTPYPAALVVAKVSLQQGEILTFKLINR